MAGRKTVAIQHFYTFYQVNPVQLFGEKQVWPRRPNQVFNNLRNCKRDEITGSQQKALSKIDEQNDNSNDGTAQTIAQMSKIFKENIGKNSMDTVYGKVNFFFRKNQHQHNTKNQ